MKTMTKIRKLEEYKKIRTKLERILKSSYELEELLDENNSISWLIRDTLIDISRVTKKIQDLEFEINRTADFDGGY